MKNSDKKLILMFFVLSCLLTGCATKNVSQIDIYTISPEWVDSRVQRQEKNLFIIKLAPVRGARTLAGTEILYTGISYDQNSYAYSRWSDAPVRLLGSLFQVALEENGGFAAVLPPTSVSNADFLLESILYDFSLHINKDGTSEGVIRARFHLVNTKVQLVAATKELTSTVPASDQSAQAAVVALNKAASNVARDLVIWLADPMRF